MVILAIDFVVFYDDLMFWVQHIAMFSVLGLLVIACVGFFFNRRITVNCIIVVFGIIIFGTILEQTLNLRIISFEMILGLFSDLFSDLQA